MHLKTQVLRCINDAGKYYKGGPKPSGPRQAIFSDDKLEQVAPLIGLMKDIGSAHGDKTPVQVAINWVICKGAIPIVGKLACTVALQIHTCPVALGRFTSTSV